MADLMAWEHVSVALSHLAWDVDGCVLCVKLERAAEFMDAPPEERIGVHYAGCPIGQLGDDIDGMRKQAVSPVVCAPGTHRWEYEPGTLTWAWLGQVKVDASIERCAGCGLRRTKLMAQTEDRLIRESYAEAMTSAPAPQ